MNRTDHYYRTRGPLQQVRDNKLFALKLSRRRTTDTVYLCRLPCGGLTIRFGATPAGCEVLAAYQEGRDVLRRVVEVQAVA